MIILDTNVISETQRKRPDPNVMAWLDAQEPTNLYLTAITVGELMFGVSSMEAGPRRDRLGAAVAAIVEEDFRDRILPYDTSAALKYGRAVGAARRRGISIGQADGQIAAIAVANGGAPVASRDRKPFEALRLDVIDPWTALPSGGRPLE